jgi:hypothetical protein
MHANKSNPELVTELESVGDRLAAVKTMKPTDQAAALFAIFDQALPELVKLAADRLAIVPKMTAGAADVIFERERQQEQEHFDPEHDDQHIGGELAIAAACYLNPNPRHTNTGVPAAWPWSDEWWKPARDPRMDTPADYRRRLVKGVALGLAEIDRFDRSAARRHVEG